MKRFFIGVVVVCLVVPGLTAARNSYLNALKARYGIANGSKLDTCNTCHVSGQPYSQRNPYGADIALNNPSTDIDAALVAVENEDSDNDGALNWVELVNGTFPGDPLDTTPVVPTTWGKIKKLFD